MYKFVYNKVKTVASTSFSLYCKEIIAIVAESFCTAASIFTIYSLHFLNNPLFE